MRPGGEFVRTRSGELRDVLQFGELAAAALRIELDRTRYAVAERPRRVLRRPLPGLYLNVQELCVWP